MGAAPGTDLTGGVGGRPSNIWAILLNLTPNNLAIGGQAFGREAPKFGAEGVVLENFNDFSENLFLKNEIKSENLGVWG